MADPLKTKLQVALQRTVNTGGDIDNSVLTPFMDWFNKSRKHLVFTAGNRYEPIETSAILAHYASRYSVHLPVYCPILLVERFSNTPGDTRAVYIYDLHLLGLMDTRDVLRFISYMKFALMCDIRFIMALPASLSLSDLDEYFKNKKVAGMMAQVICNQRSCAVMEV